MALCDEFLKQANALARRKGRPSQINLRRATSAAYYAVFHLLIKEAVDLTVPAQPVELRPRAARALQHGEMKDICKSFQNVAPPQKLLTLVGPVVPLELRAISKTFVDLQDERHAADYDTSLKLSQSAALNSVANAQAAFLQWKTIRGTSAANVFLAALLFGKRWDR